MKKVIYYKTCMLKLGLFQAIIVKSRRLLQSAHIAFLILLLTLHIFSPSSIFAVCIYGNCTNGHGTSTWPNGQKYVGEFKDGKANGQGIYTWPNGQKYVGEFRNNKSDGQGIYTWPNGQKYVGEFRDDKSDGQGIYTWPTWQKYVGEFRDDNFNGHGNETYPDGSKYEGEFRDGQRNGQGTLTGSDGEKYEGEFKNDKPNGQGNETYPDRGRNVGEFRDDKPSVNGTLRTLINWYIVFGGIFFFIVVTLIFLWYRNTANNNQKDNSYSTSGFSNKEDYETFKLSKMDQNKNISQNKNTFKEAVPDQQSLENDADINRCYQVLQLKPGVSKEEIRGAYKTLLIVWDSHKRTDYPTLQKRAQETIKEIDEAYEKLILHMAAESSAAKQVSSD